MYYYCQYLTGSLRGVKKIVTDIDFKHPLQVFTPAAVNKNLKYKVLGDDKQYWQAGILFVAETTVELNKLITSERPRFNSKYLQSDSSSSDTFNAAGSSKIDKSRQTDARATKIQQQILQKQTEVRAKCHILPFKSPLPNPTHIGRIETKNEKVKKKSSNRDASSTQKNLYGAPVASLPAVPPEPVTSFTNSKTAASSKQTFKSNVIPIISASVKTNLPHQNKIVLLSDEYIAGDIPTNSLPLDTITADENHFSQRPESSISASTDSEASSGNTVVRGLSKHSRATNKQLPSSLDKSNSQINLSCQKLIQTITSTVPQKCTEGSGPTNHYKKSELQTLILGEESNSTMTKIHCQDPICQLRVLRSETTISNLTQLLDQQLKANDELQLELRDLRERKNELHQKLENSFEEFQARIFDNNNKPSPASAYPPKGFVRTSDKHIHLGRGVWLPRSKLNEACNVNSPSLFVKVLCDMLFTSEELKGSTITGTDSNRRRGCSRVPKKLDPTRVLAIKDITKYWLEILKYSEEAVDVQVSKVKGHISSKIAELQRGPRKNQGLKRRKEIDEEENISDPESSTADESHKLLTVRDPNPVDGDAEFTNEYIPNCDNESAGQIEHDSCSEDDAHILDDNSNLIITDPNELEWEQLRRIEQMDYSSG